MVSLREAIFFFAGVELYHTLVGLLLYVFARSPIDMTYTVLTSAHLGRNAIIHGLITGLLVAWAWKLGEDRQPAEQVVRVRNTIGEQDV